MATGIASVSGREEGVLETVTVWRAHTLSQQGSHRAASTVQDGGPLFARAAAFSREAENVGFYVKLDNFKCGQSSKNLKAR